MLKLLKVIITYLLPIAIGLVVTYFMLLAGGDARFYAYLTLPAIITSGITIGLISQSWKKVLYIALFTSFAITLLVPFFINKLNFPTDSISDYALITLRNIKPHGVLAVLLLISSIIYLVRVLIKRTIAFLIALDK